jgi:hypothetical protein
VTLALISIWSASDSNRLKQSYGTLYITGYQDDNALAVIDVKTVVSVVSMVPMPPEERQAEIENNIFFLVERSGLEAYELAGIGEEDGDNESSSHPLARFSSPITS